MAYVLSAAGNSRWGTAHPSWAVSACTIIVVMKRTADAAGVLAWAVGTDDGTFTSKGGMGFDASNKLFLGTATGTTVSAPTMTGTVADGWCAYGATKTSGSVAPRFHKYSYTTGAASHETSGSALADGTTTATPFMSIGRSNTSASTTSFGSYAAVALYSRALSDQEFESAAASLTGMMAANPDRGLWVFDNTVTTGLFESFIGSGSVGGTPAGVDSGSVPFPYGHPVTYARTYREPPALLATYQADLDRVKIYVTGIDVTGVSAVVDRSENGVTWTTVRGGADVDVTSGQLTLYDYEFTPGVSTTYRVRVYDT